MDSLWKKLLAPFPESDIDWLLKEDDVSRASDGTYRGRVFAYVNARAVQQRLDDIFGIYWSTKLVPAFFGGGTRAGVICELSVYLPAVGWLTKSDACDLSSIEPVRGGASGALKRVAVQYGIGRYLYSLPEAFVPLAEAGGSRRIRVEGKQMTWNEPLLPEWALPEADRPARAQFLKEIAAKQESDAADAKARQDATDAAKVAAESAKIAADQSDAAKRSEAQAKPLKPATPEQCGSGTVPFPVQMASERPAARPVNQPPGQVVKTGGLSMGQLASLQDIFGIDIPLALTVLKHKKMLPTGATSIEQLPVSYATALIQNTATIASRMKILASVSKIVAGRHTNATTYFVARSLVKANEPWFSATDENLKKALDGGEALARALDKMSGSQPVAA